MRVKRRVTIISENPGIVFADKIPSVAIGNRVATAAPAGPVVRPIREE